MEWNKLMATRKSCREYTDEQITDEQLKAILKAGCAAPVARGKFEQVQMTVVQDKALLDLIDTAAKAGYGDENFSCTRGAPTVIVVSVAEEQGQISPMMIASAGCVVQNMHLAATDLGLGSVYLGSIQAVNNSFEVLYKLKLKDGFWPVAALAVGNAKEPAEERAIPMTKIFTNIIE
ncbi:MAG: nitroreductase family protein [Clostridia bacterium]|nr:nitroreductase family protein [Clostridia bacterium]